MNIDLYKSVLYNFSDTFKEEINFTYSDDTIEVPNNITYFRFYGATKSFTPLHI